MITASTSLWYLYALIVYFVVCKIFSRLALPLFALFVLMSVAVNFVPTPWWGMNSVIRNLPYYSLGAWFGATLMTCVKEVIVAPPSADGFFADRSGGRCLVV